MKNMPFLKNTYHYVAITLFALLTGCTSTSMRPETASSQAHHHAKEITTWESSGAIAARNQQKGWTASFNWVQQGPDTYQIRLFGPLGSGTILIDRKQGITAYHDGKQVTSGKNADLLLQEKTGVTLPVSHLYYWGRGLAAPGPVTAVHMNAHHQLEQLEQSGYRIEYLNYMNVNGVDLPHQIKLTGHDVHIKIVIKKWSV